MSECACVCIMYNLNSFIVKKEVIFKVISLRLEAVQCQTLD